MSNQAEYQARFISDQPRAALGEVWKVILTKKTRCFNVWEVVNFNKDGSSLNFRLKKNDSNNQYIEGGIAICIVEA